MCEVHCEAAARTGPDISPEGLAALVKLAFADRDDTPVQPAKNTIDIIQQLSGGQAALREIDQVGWIIGIAAAQRCCGCEPADIAAQNFDKFNLARQSSVVGSNVACGACEEARGRAVPGRMMRLHQIVIDGLGDADDEPDNILRT